MRFSKKIVEFKIVENQLLSNLIFDLEYVLDSINNKHHLTFVALDYQVTLVGEKLLHSAVVSFDRDEVDAEKEKKYPARYLKGHIACEFVLGNTKEEFEESLKYSMEKVNSNLNNTYREFQYRPVSLDGEIKYFGVILYNKKAFITMDNYQKTRGDRLNHVISRFLIKIKEFLKNKDYIKKICLFFDIIFLTMK